LDAVELTTEGTVDKTRYARCENIGALAVQLQRLLSGIEKFVLVFDGIDHQREAPPTLLPAMARFSEYVRLALLSVGQNITDNKSQIPNLTIIFIVTFPRQRFLHKLGVPHVHFPSYTREEALRIVTASPLDIFSEPESPSEQYDEEARNEDNAWLWGRFCAAVWDSLAKGAARDIISFRSLAERLWKPFVAPILDGTYGTRDFSRLMVAKRALFQGEKQLINRLILRGSQMTSTKKCMSMYFNALL